MNEELLEALMSLMQAAHNDNYAEVNRILQQHPELLRVIQEIEQNDEEQSSLDLLVRQARNAEQRYLQHSDVSGLDEAIDYWQQILQSPDLSSKDKEFQWVILNDNAVTHWYRYGAKGDFQDLNTALQKWEWLVKNVSADSQNLPMFLNNLGGGLKDRYLRLGDLADLENGIMFLRQAVANDSPNLPKYLVSLGSVLRERYLRLGKLADLDESIVIYRQAIAKTPPNSSDLVKSLNNLGNALNARYLQLGLLTDLEEAITVYRQIIKKVQSDSPYLPGLLNNLSNGLKFRYAHLGDLADLDESITKAREAVEKTPLDSPDLPMYLNNLSEKLNTCYLRLGRLSDLEEAIVFAQQAVEKTPTDSPNLSDRLNNLGNALSSRYLHLNALDDLEKGIAVFRQAIVRASRSSLHLSNLINNLGNGLIDRYLHLGSFGDLKEGVQKIREAIEKTPTDSPLLSRRFNNLGNGLKELYLFSGKLADLKGGIAAYRKAIELDKKGSLENLLRHSANLLNWAFERSSWQEIEDVYPNVQLASQQLMEKQLEREHQEAFLTETQGLAAQVAYARIQTQNLVGAVEALEQGVARLLTAALARDNADVSQLQQDCPDLYARYVEQNVEAKNAQHFYQNANDNQRKTAFEQWQQQEVAFQAVLNEIRQQPTHENFLKIATDINRVYQAAETKPLVYIFYTDKDGYALQVFKKDIQAIALPELTTEKWQAQFDKYFNAYNNAQNNQNEWKQAIDDLTAWLYTAMMQPILKNIDCSELTLIPIGYLNLFPLHLAWTGEPKQYVLDKVTFNYAPNALALVNAQKQANVPLNALLAINEPLPVNASILPSSKMETLAIKQHFKENTELVGEQATVAAVKTALNDVPNVLHFSCHGGANVQNALQTGLLMANDEMLTVADFFKAQLQARLVSLSACETGVIGFEKAEEVVGLPTSLLHAGAAGVVASLWSVNDASTALLMMRFYDNFIRQKQAPEVALREAQLWLRNAKPRSYTEFLNATLPAEQAKNLREKIGSQNYSHPYYWGAFYHTGI